MLPEFGAKRLKQITVADIRKWMAAMTEEGLAPSTVYTYRRVLGQILEQAVDDGLRAGRIGNLLEAPCEGTTVADAAVRYPTPPSTTTTSTTPTSTVAGSADVVIANIRYDGPGNDVEFGDSEYVLLHNNGTGTADIGSWSQEDEAGHVITNPSGYVIQPGGELRIYSGPGDNTATSYYDGLGQAIWNNSGGDTATLRDESGQTVDSYSYSS